MLLEDKGSLLTAACRGDNSFAPSATIMATASCWLSGLSSTVTTRYSALSTHRCLVSTSRGAAAALLTPKFIPTAASKRDPKTSKDKVMLEVIRIVPGCHCNASLSEAACHLSNWVLCRSFDCCRCQTSQIAKHIS